MRTRIEAWYREHGAALLLFGLALARGDRGRAQDALHHVFLKLLEARSLDHISDPRTYLFTALRNTLLNDARRSGRLIPLADDRPWFPDHADGLALRRALESLADDQRADVCPGGRGAGHQCEYRGLPLPVRARETARSPCSPGDPPCRMISNSIWPASGLWSPIRSTVRGRRLPWWLAPVAAAAAVAVAAAVWTGRWSEPPPGEVAPLTIGRASSLLATEAPWKATLDRAALPEHRTAASRSLESLPLEDSHR